MSLREDFGKNYSGFFCLNSSNSKHAYPNNTASDFTNILQTPLANTDTKPFELRLVSISLSTKYAEPVTAEPSGYLKIEIEEVEKQRQGRKFVHFSGGFPYPPSTRLTDDYGIHEFRNQPSLPLRFQHLEHFRVRIVDENDELIKLYDNYPTILWVEMSQSDKHEEQFIITCDSYHPSLYLDNKLYNFNTPLPSELHLSNYEVALLNVYYPPRLYESVTPAILSIEERQMTFYPNDYNTTEAFIRSVNDTLRRGRYGWAYRLVELQLSNYEDPTLCLTRMSLPPNATQQPVPHRINMNVTFLRACGQIDSPGKAMIMLPGDIIMLKGTPNISNVHPTPVSLLLCDIIKPNIMGTGAVKMLQCVPLYLNKEYHEKRLYEPQQLAFQNVVNSPFDRINFSFLHPDGRSREFKTDNPSDDILINLVFRPKKH